MFGRKKFEIRICVPQEDMEGSNLRAIEETLKTVFKEKFIESVGWLDDEFGIKIVVICSEGQFDEICKRIMNLRSQKDKRFYINWREKNI